MSVFLRQSTAVDVAIGPFLDSTDGATAETALTLSQADIRLKKNNANWAQKADTNAAPHEENGWYEASLNSTDTNTVGRLVLAVNESGALPVWHDFWVLEEAVYDALYAASSPGYASQTSVDTVAGYIDTEVAAIKAKTDLLPASPAAVGSAMTLDMTQTVSDVGGAANTLGGILGLLRAAMDGKFTNVSGLLKYFGQDNTTQVGVSRTVSGTVPSDFVRS